MIYARIAGGAIAERRDFESKPPDVPAKGWRWLPVVESFPAYDPTTHVPLPITETIETTRVVISYTVRAKNQADMDAEKDSVIGGLDLVVLKTLFNHENRIRTLESKAALTLAQFRTGLRALL